MNESVNVKQYKFDRPLTHMIDSKIDNCIRDCNNNFFHIYDHICAQDIQLTNIRNFEIVNITISDKSMKIYELSKKVTFARGNGFIFNRINKSKRKTFSKLFNTKTQSYLR